VSDPYYITTPIYYVTDAPHIGHLYTTTATDMMARYHRLLGQETWFLTGTDEHGQKIQKKATENGETPQALADRVVERYREAWNKYNISYDDFIRTTEERHKKVVTTYVKQLMDSGDIYLGTYEGWYCVPCESYWTESQLKDGNCPECKRPIDKLQEESYFFKMSAYEKRLIEHIEKNPDFIIPESRKNEVLGFIKQGLKDISISRTTIEWGIPMPEDEKATQKHKVYVWFDALTNYISALGPFEKNSKFSEYWPQAVHVVGKDILRFHAVYWPTFLMALKIKVPVQIVAHGWLLDANRKISKSLGNAVDPMKLAETVGVDGIRYFLMREFVFGLDGEYTEDTIYHRVNSDLANDYGNGISRVCSMLIKYDIKPQSLSGNSELSEITEKSIEGYHREMKTFSFNRALEQVGNILTGISRYIETTKPWALAKSEDAKDRTKLEQALLHCHESLRVASLLLWPVIPSSSEKALEYLGDNVSLKAKAPLELANWGKGPNQYQVSKGPAIFPRLELPKKG